MAHFPVGSRTESKENNGITHFLEHMVFTGTERWDEAEVTEVVRRRGGDCNAQTSREETVFHIHLPAAEFEFGMEWLYQLLFKPTLLPDKFEKERQVIINEKGGEFDRLRRIWEWIEDRNLGWNVSRAVRRRLYPNSSLLLPIIGEDRTLKSLTHTMLVDYYRRFYVPANMTLLIVGDIERVKATEYAQKFFGQIPAATSPPVHPPVSVADSSFHVILKGPAFNEQGQFLIGTVLDAANHPARFAWWVIAEMLENVYMRDIRYQQGLSYGVSVFPVLYTDTGYLAIYTTAKIEDFKVIRATVEKHLDRLVAGDFLPAELEEAKTALKGRALLSIQDTLELAWWLCADVLNFRNVEGEIPDYFAMLEAVTVEEVQRAARRYLSPEKRFSVEHRPGITPRRLRSLATTSALGSASAALLFSRLRPRGRSS